MQVEKDALRVENDRLQGEDNQRIGSKNELPDKAKINCDDRDEANRRANVQDLEKLMLDDNEVDQAGK